MRPEEAVVELDEVVVADDCFLGDETFEVAIHGELEFGVVVWDFGFLVQFVERGAEFFVEAPEARKADARGVEAVVAV